MKLFSATDFAIRTAEREGTLRLTEHADRWGGLYVAIADQFGLIEVAPDMSAAKQRVSSCADIRRT